MGKVRIIITEPQAIIKQAEMELSGELSKDPFSSMIILPSPAACRQIINSQLGDGLVHLGQPVCTLDNLSQTLFDEVSKSEIFIERQQAELIIRKIMDEHRNDLSLFEPLWAGLGPTVTELRALFDTWRKFCINIDRVDGTEQSNQVKNIFVKYLEQMRNDHLVDQIGLEETVIRWLHEGKVTVRKKISMIGLNELCPLDRKFVKALTESAEETVFITRQDGGNTFNEDFSWLGTDKTGEGLLTPVEDMAFLGESVDLRCQSFSDPLSEARAVSLEVRSLLDSGVSPSNICILLPMRHSADELYREALDDCGVWCNLDVPTDLFRSPIVHTLLELFEAVADGMSREKIVRLLSSPYFRFRYDLNGEEKILHGGMVGKIADEAGVIRGLLEWDEKLDRLRQDLELEADSPEVPEVKAQKMRLKSIRVASTLVGLRDLFARLKIIDGRMSVEKRVSAIKHLLLKLEVDKHLKHEDDRVYRREAKALTSFFKILDSLVEMERYSPSKEENLVSFASKIRLLCSEAKDSIEPRYENAVLVTGLRSALLMHHDYVFIVGMVEGDLPYLGAGNPFIKEEDIANFQLLDKRDMLRQERYHFFSALLSAGKGIRLSCHATKDGEKVVSSSFYEDVVRIRKPQGFVGTKFHGSRSQEQRALGEAVAAKRSSDGILHAIPFSVGELLRKINVEAYSRREEYDSPFDGMLSDTSILTDLDSLVGTNHVFSPTELDMYASCPHRYYLSNILKIDPRPQLETEISGKDQGNFVHDVAYQTFSRMRTMGIQRITLSNIKDVETIANEVAEEELAKLQFSGPSFEAFKARMAGSNHRIGLLKAFLNYEAENTTTFNPRYFELSFGRKLPRDCDPASRAEPISIMLSPKERVLLAGRVDRIDLRDDGKFMVIDYKTGELPSQKDVMAAKSLQVQLYLQGVQSLLTGSKGIGGLFYRIKSESEIEYATLILDKTEEADLKPIIGRKRLIESTDALIVNTNLKIIEMLQKMRKGQYHPAVSEGDCKSYCEYKTVCRFDALRTLSMGGE